MKNRRGSILREMGLAPLWRIRAPGNKAPGSELRAPGNKAAGSELRAPGELAADQAGERPRQGAPAAMPEQATSAPATAAAAQPLGDSRAAAIARMGWDELRASVAACRACRLCEKRTQTVFGVGDLQPDWLFVGEGPGAEEDRQGEPFVGQAGKLLDAMLAALGLRRGKNVYIANTVKCRPPGNRTPEPAESAACAPYLARQIELLRPKLIVALGRPAAQTLLRQESIKIASARGRLFAYEGIPLIVTYHPAYLLRNLGDKALAWEDLCFARATMERLQRESPAATR